jgi:hypothetical protein
MEWWAVLDSNQRPLRCEHSALPAELTALDLKRYGALSVCLSLTLSQIRLRETDLAIGRETSQGRVRKRAHEG